MVLVTNAANLLERRSELVELAGDVTAARAGTGRLVLVEGPAGIGKTEILRAARSLAEEAGMVVAAARGTELETGFAFGVVRQLFEPLLRECSERDRERLLRGAAVLATDVIDGRDGDSAREAIRSPEALHGLYWLTLNLAERAPLAVMIDDAHWADQASLRFLSYLAGRLEGVGVLAIVAARREATRDIDDLLDRVARERSTTSMELRPLSSAAAADLIAREYDDVAPEFAQACHQATGGNPFFLRELVRALRADDVSPTATEASRVAMQGPSSVARSVLIRIAGLSRTAPDVARALAVLGGEATVRYLVMVTALGEAAVVAALDGLSDAEIVVGVDPVAFAHPIVRASIYADIPPGERGRAHLRAARSLADAAEPAERVAAHLLCARPGADEWAVRVLTDAANEALSRGAPESAAQYLTRAVAESPAGNDMHELLAVLGRSEYLAYQSGASAHLIEAMNGAVTVAERGELALQAASAMITQDPDRSEAATQLLDRMIGELAQPSSQLSMRLEAQLLAAAGLKLSTRPLQLERMSGVYSRRLGDEPAERLLLANLAHWTLIDGRHPGRFEDLGRQAGRSGAPAEVACRVAERALADGRLLREEGPDSQLFYLATATLCLGDELDRAEHWLDLALEDARKLGSVLGYGIASASLAQVHYRRGDLTKAEAHARAAADISPEDAAGVLVGILIEQGRLDEADRVLARYRIPPDADHLLLQPIRAAGAWVRLARGRAEEAASEMVTCAKWLEAWSLKNPTYVSWRSCVSLACNQLGDHERARQTATEEVELAKPLGQRRALGIALRTLATVEPSSDRVDQLRASVAEFERSAAQLEHARALVDYGAALRRTGHRADAREPLRQGLDLAHHCRAPVLAERARQELLASGARPRRPALTGRDALTPTEARVANMAAGGLSTPEIAQALFITPKTVETHLGHIYQKLDIHTRAELARALSDRRGT